MKFVPPSVRETAFNCPHCGALTTQFWYSTRIAPVAGERKLSTVFSDDQVAKFNFDNIDDLEKRNEVLEFLQKAAKGFPFLSEKRRDDYRLHEIHNLSVSECFNCKALSIWLHERLVYPQSTEAPPPNPELSADVRRDYIEASTLLDPSPRAAAALLRLAIQKLCMDLGLPGRNLNEDIGALVERGLDVRIQKALDTVRVIGNNALHPGQIDS